MKNLIGILLLVMLTTACSSSEDDCCESIAGNDVSYQFSVVNVDGVDLLNPSSEGSLNSNNINVYSVEDGERIQLYNAEYTYSDYYKIVEGSDGIYYMTVFFDMFDTKMTMTRVISWNSELEDEMVMTMKEGNPGNPDDSFLRIDRILWNEQEAWNIPDFRDGERVFKIMKD